MKEIDLVARAQYWRIFLALVFPCCIGGFAAFFAIGWIALPVALLLNTLLPFVLRMLTERAADFFVPLFTGGLRMPATLHEQLAGELVKVRHLKAGGRFAEALHTADFVLEKLPKHADTLLLKAQILSEGFADDAAAKDCLRTIIWQEPPPEETVRRWATEMLEELNSRMWQETAARLGANQ